MTDRRQRTIDIADAVIMQMIRQNPKVSQAAIAEAARISRQSVSKRVNDLATLRYIDHRGFTNTITEKGVQFLASLKIEIYYRMPEEQTEILRVANETKASVIDCG